VSSFLTAHQHIKQAIVYCQTVTTFSATYCLTRLIMNTIFESAVTIARCVLKEMRKTF